VELKLDLLGSVITRKPVETEGDLSGGISNLPPAERPASREAGDRSQDPEHQEDLSNPLKAAHSLLKGEILFDLDLAGKWSCHRTLVGGRD
jgi:hypothetical protein